MTPGNATITIVINIVLWQIFSSVCGNIFAFDVSDFAANLLSKASTCFKSSALRDSFSIIVNSSNLRDGNFTQMHLMFFMDGGTTTTADESTRQ